MKANHTTVLLLIAALLVVSMGEVPSVSGLIGSESLVTGPYVDEVIYRVMPNQDQRFLDLLSGEIEMDCSFFDPVLYDILNEDPDIDIYRAFRNGYGHITINCAKYPLNISGLRRAFAFAFDKTRVTSEVMDGYSIEHDSLIPLANGWCVENQFDWHYYTAQPDIGNQILDELNFNVDSETGFRSAPNGTPFDIIFEFAGDVSFFGWIPIQIGLDALDSLHINASARPARYNELLSRLGNHGDYDMVFGSTNYYNYDVNWLAFDYWSEYADVQYQNPSNFANETYDSWRDQLLYGTIFEKVYEASAEMQKILQYNVPRLVVYENTYLQAYRNDVFTGHVEDIGRYISGPWTMRKIHKLDGTFGGTVYIAISEEPDSFNIFTTDSAYSATILDELWPSLYDYGPDMIPCGDLAQSLLTETHSDNPTVPDGHVRFTIDIVQNATWSDGTPLTADDVAFSFTYELERILNGQPAGSDLGDLAAVYAPTQYQVVIEFNTETYWHFNDFAFRYIIPEHIFNDDTGVGYEDWINWNPVFDPAEPNVNSGPYMFSDYEAGEFYELSYNPNFYYCPKHTTATTTTTTTEINQTTAQEMYWLIVISTALISGTGIVVSFYVLIRLQNYKLKRI